MHGTTMMFLFAVPVMQAIGLYLVPLMIGARNVAFPRLNAYGYWRLSVRRSLSLHQLLPEHRPRRRLVQPTCRWPGRSFRPGKRVDVWAQTITFTEIAALVARSS